MIEKTYLAQYPELILEEDDDVSELIQALSIYEKHLEERND